MTGNEKKHLIRGSFVLAVAAIVAAPLQAQMPASRPRPADWQVRFDRPAPDSALVFVDMAPGWHVTTGPSTILYDPSNTASGAFRVEARMVLFAQSRHPEGFGIIIGGRDLDGAGQAYTYFLIRQDGRFLVKRRDGTATRDLVAWTAHPAITPHPGTRQTVPNVLSIEAGTAEVRFLVNGQQVASLPRASVAPDGIVGMRVNHNLDLHVTTLAIDGRNVAPEAPARR